MAVAEISAKLVKELRDSTGAGMMDCKRALTESGGDMEAAKDWLRKRGQAIANKKASRKASEGLVTCLLRDGGRLGVILELNCETDFVARNEDFKRFLVQLAEQIAEGGPGADEGDVEAFLAGPAPNDGARTNSDVLREMVAKVGENLGLGAFRRLKAGRDERLHYYIHPPGKLAVMVGVSAGNAATLDRPEFKALCDDLAMHVTAAAPDFLTRDQVPPEVLDRERDIYREQLRNEGKPDAMIDKIVEGKIAKLYYKQACLLEQDFVKNPEETIAEVVKRAGKEMGDAIAVVRFERLKVGG
jgi:elongation factor Ts